MATKRLRVIQWFRRTWKLEREEQITSGELGPSSEFEKVLNVLP